MAEIRGLRNLPPAERIIVFLGREIRYLFLETCVQEGEFLSNAYCGILDTRYVA